MIKIIKRYLKKKTVHNLGIVVLENVLSKAFRFALIVLVARKLGPEDYGAYSLITVSVLFFYLLIDFGTENTVVKFSGQYTKKENQIFGYYFILKSSILAFLLLGITIWPQLINMLLNKPGADKYLYIIFIGCLVESYQYIIATYFQSQGWNVDGVHERKYVSDFVGLSAFPKKDGSVEFIVGRNEKLKAYSL